jgi:hypothetical protein
MNLNKIKTSFRWKIGGKPLKTVDKLSIKSAFLHKNENYVRIHL